MYRSGIQLFILVDCFLGIGDAVDGALDEGAVDVACCGIEFEAVDLTGAQAISELQLMRHGIDDGKHATTRAAVYEAVMLQHNAGGMLVAEAQIHFP